MWWGEESVLLQMWHPSDEGIGKCPRCHQAAYNDGEQMCPVCYGTGLFHEETQTGGIKAAVRVWCLFTDHVVSEEYGQRGVLKADNREVTTEAFPLLTEHDFIARVRRWDPTTYTALDDPRFYSLSAITRQSLRTGHRYGQTWEDIIGQTAQLSWIPDNTMGIQLFPIEGQSFPPVTITGTPTPQVVAQPDTKVIYVPVPEDVPGPGSGNVIGASVEWLPVFTFPQIAPATPWIITHSLGHDPEVTIIIDGEEVSADVTYPDATTVRIDFAEPQSGIAELV
jgi:hypothetical protein